MDTNFISGNYAQAGKTQNSSDVAAILAMERKKKPESPQADVAAVLAMSNQVPLQAGTRDLCIA